MILDKLSEWRRYAALSPRFAPAFGFLEQAGPSLALGRHPIAGDDVFALVQRYTTKPYAEQQYEAHRRYIDVQYMMSGCESIYWAPLPRLTEVTRPFDESIDAALWRVIPDGVSFALAAGHFAILFPEDGHAPACDHGASAEVTKIVVKVRV